MTHHAFDPDLVPQGYDYADAVAFAANGDLLVGGSAQTGDNNASDGFVVALDSSSGDVDTDFGDQGAVYFSFDLGVHFDQVVVKAFHVAADGRILIAGDANHDDEFFNTLTNTLLGREKMKTNAVRTNDSRGRHTTTSRVLTPLPQGGCLIDTPGMREVKLSGDEDVTESFDDIEAIAVHCRFRDCAHGNEPGCAVQAAIEDGTLDEARYLNFVKLRDDLEAAAVTQAQRRAEERVMGKALNKRLKDKYGRR